MIGFTKDNLPTIFLVESNDALWGADPRFVLEIDSMTAIVVGEVLNLLKELGPCRRQAQLASALFFRVATRAGRPLFFIKFNYSFFFFKI